MTASPARQQLRLQLARFLMARYAADVELRILRTKGNPKAWIWIQSDGSQETERIDWANGDGLTSLLHEIGHHRVRETPSGETGDTLISLIWEARAWVWGEECARRENLYFNYELADRSFATHAGELPVRINWRYARA